MLSSPFRRCRCEGWAEAQHVISELFSRESDRKGAVKQLGQCVRAFRAGKLEPVLSNSGIIASFRLAASLEYFKDICQVLPQIALTTRREVDRPYNVHSVGGWWYLSNSEDLPKYVQEAVELQRTNGGFRMEFKEHTVFETREYGGTGVNAYKRERVEVTIRTCPARILPP